MHVHVHRRRIELEKEKRDRKLPFHQRGVIALAQARAVSTGLSIARPFTKTSCCARLVPAHSRLADQPADPNLRGGSRFLDRARGARRARSPCRSRMRSRSVVGRGKLKDDPLVAHKAKSDFADDRSPADEAGARCCGSRYFPSAEISGAPADCRRASALRPASPALRRHRAPFRSARPRR